MVRELTSGFCSEANSSQFQDQTINIPQMAQEIYDTSIRHAVDPQRDVIDTYRRLVLELCGEFKANPYMNGKSYNDNRLLLVREFENLQSMEANDTAVLREKVPDLVNAYINLHPEYPNISDAQRGELRNFLSMIITQNARTVPEEAAQVEIYQDDALSRLESDKRNLLSARQAYQDCMAAYNKDRTPENKHALDLSLGVYRQAYDDEIIPDLNHLPDELSDQMTDLGIPTGDRNAITSIIHSDYQDVYNALNPAPPRADSVQ